MNVMPRASQWEQLIRPDRVHGSLYSDPAIFEAELQNIWYRTWVYVGHESEVPNVNDYVVKSIGPQSIIMTRDEQGKINLLLNRCSHRGNEVCSYPKGNARSFTCPFHAWTFANDGRLAGYAFPDGYEGQDRSELALGRVADVYDREVAAAVKRFLAVLEPALILGLAVLIGGIVFSILLGVMGMSELVV